jgi:hypothetical protein
MDPSLTTPPMFSLTIISTAALLGHPYRGEAGLGNGFE